MESSHDDVQGQPGSETLGRKRTLGWDLPEARKPGREGQVTEQAHWDLVRRADACWLAALVQQVAEEKKSQAVRRMAGSP
jgi:hypothetical protein